MTSNTKSVALKRLGPMSSTGGRKGRALRRITSGSEAQICGLDELEREALHQSRLIMAALMSPGQRFPTRRQLGRAWRAIRALDRAEASLLSLRSPPEPQ